MATHEPRTDKKGRITYRAKIRLLGQPTATRTFTKLAAAKAWAAATETAMRDGSYAAGSGRKLSEAIDSYLNCELSTKKDERMLRDRLAWWRARLGHLRLRDLNA